MVETSLRQLGLSDNEVRIYLSLLPLKKAASSTLGYRTNLERNTARYTCQQLARKGLIAETQEGNTLFYNPEPPDKILFMLENAKKEILQKEEQANRIIGHLRTMADPKTALPKVRFFEGEDGIIEMFEDVLKENKPLYGAVTIPKDLPQKILDYKEKIYYPKKKELFFPTWGIFSDDKQTKGLQKLDHQVNRQSLLVPADEFPIEICYHIYGNKVSFYSYAPGDMTGVIIENEHIRKTQMSIFKMAWEFAKTLPENKKKRDISLEVL